MVKHTKKSKRIKIKPKSRESLKSRLGVFVASYLTYASLAINAKSSELSLPYIILWFVTPIIPLSYIYFYRQELSEWTSYFFKQWYGRFSKIVAIIFFFVISTWLFIIIKQDWLPPYEHISAWLPFAGTFMLCYFLWFHFDSYLKIENLRGGLHLVCFGIVGSFTILFFGGILWGIKSNALVVIMCALIGVYVPLYFVVFAWDIVINIIEKGFRVEAIYEWKEMISDIERAKKNHIQKQGGK